ncbi:hypothetical protein M7I_2034 [Glarea lozoyensis 74030]|uniref:Uncharacterized protein n=1 Tax=Glarea lozoyensis (strain ATCC 74030 / MF5533) TaxID=1104152 RepID=H0EHQ0_GLAL7|nr:hypothetical protein M7I_2034 [Glarea lozoyensis 74030]
MKSYLTKIVFNPHAKREDPVLVPRANSKKTPVAAPNKKVTTSALAKIPKSTPVSKTRSPAKSPTKSAIKSNAKSTTTKSTAAKSGTRSATKTFARATGTASQGAKKTGNADIPVASDAAELRKDIPADLDPKDVPKGKVPDSCPMPAGGGSGTGATPSAAATASVKKPDISKRSPSSFSSHTRAARANKDKLHSYLSRQRQARDAAADARRQLRELDQDLLDHRDARIHLTVEQPRLERRLRDLKADRRRFKRSIQTYTRDLLYELCWLEDYADNMQRSLPAEIAEMIADYSYYERLAEDDPDA